MKVGWFPSGSAYSIIELLWLQALDAELQGQFLCGLVGPDMALTQSHADGSNVC